MTCRFGGYLLISAVLLLVSASSVVAGPDWIVFEALHETTIGAEYDSSNGKMVFSAIEANSIRKSMLIPLDMGAGDSQTWGTIAGGVYTRLRFYLYADVSWHNNGGTMNPLAIYNTAGVAFMKLRILDTESLEYRLFNHAGDASGAWTALFTIGTEQWYEIEVFMEMVNAVGGFYAFVDGVQLASVATSWSGDTPDYFYIGGFGIDEGGDGKLYFDDVVVDTTALDSLDYHIPSVQAELHAPGRGIGGAF